MNRKNIGLVYKKEIQGAIRDRRTLISMVVIPLIFYPLLFLGIGYFSLMGQNNSETIPSAISIIGAENSPELIEILKKDKNISIVQTGDDSNSDDESMRDNIYLTIDIPETIEADYTRNTVNSKAILQPINIHYDSTAQHSLVAKKRISALMDTYRRNIIEERLNKIGLNNDFLEPFQEQWMDIAPPEKKIGFMLGSIFTLSHYYTNIHRCYELSGGYYSWRKREGNFSHSIGQPAQPTGNCVREIFFCYDHFGNKYVFRANWAQYCLSCPGFYVGRDFHNKCSFFFSLIFILFSYPGTSGRVCQCHTYPDWNICP